MASIARSLALVEPEFSFDTFALPRLSDAFATPELVVTVFNHRERIDIAALKVTRAPSPRTHANPTASLFLCTE